MHINTNAIAEDASPIQWVVFGCGYRMWSLCVADKRRHGMWQYLEKFEEEAANGVYPQICVLTQFTLIVQFKAFLICMCECVYINKYIYSYTHICQISSSREHTQHNIWGLTIVLKGVSGQCVLKRY